MPTYRCEVHISGELEKDAVSKFTGSGKHVVNLAVLTVFGEKKQHHRLVCWETLADKTAQLKRGDWVRACGYLNTRSWKDAECQVHYITEVVCWELAIGEEAPNGGTAAARAILSRPGVARG